MQQYELLYILPATLTDEEAPKLAAKISGLLQNQEARIIQEVDLGKKRLAYPIEHQHYGYYRLVEFQTEPARVQKMNDVLRLSQDVVRHQIIVKPEKSQATIEREQALRARLAARRAERLRTSSAQATTSAVAEAPAIILTPEELDKKFEKILDENPEV